MKTLAIEPLTKEAFAAFGDVIELEGAKQIPINLGTTIRYHDLAKVDVTDENGRTSPNVGRSFDYPLMAFDGHGDVALGRLPTDGAAPEDQQQMQSGDQETPPYRSVLAAMRDGWFVIQIPALPRFFRGHEHETGHLPYEYVLERRVAING